ncbi:MAG: hypothetical protein CFE37_08090 [Alphaproteobacteria bacterium PA4]|nr:MAG: hypothetical protein CFE37_08090 [Alphaproteobacteria bacterium PA4]
MIAVLAGGWSGEADAASSSLCAQAGAIVGPLACVETAHGVALAGDAARARQLGDLAEAGAGRFMASFGQRPAPYVIVEGASALAPAEKMEALRNAGFPAALPWLSETVFRQQQEQSIRRAVTAQLAGRPPELIEAAVQAGLAQIKPERRDSIERAAIPHELGHMWFRIAYWPAASLDGNQHYGGPSPDWLDEMAAVLMEAPDMFDQRLKQFSERYAGWRANPDVADANVKLLLDIGNFFAEEHPAAAPVKTLLAARTAVEKQGTVMMLTGEEASKIADGSVRFYQQSAMVSRYLAERSGDPKVLNNIAQAFARGETMAQWLANAEPKGALPRDLKAVQADWLAWLAKRFPS